MLAIHYIKLDCISGTNPIERDHSGWQMHGKVVAPVGILRQRYFYLVVAPKRDDFRPHLPNDTRRAPANR